MKPIICKTCQHWRTRQAELDYNQFIGICTCYAWKFSIDRYDDVMVLDRHNISNNTRHTHQFESQKNEVPFGEVDKSRYCLVTSEEFSCKHHKLLGKK